VHVPWATEAKVWDGPVSLEDVTATMLAFGGCDIPKYYDSRVLPELGFEGVKPRDRVFGFLASGCMNYDGEWKLAKYSSGEVMLFNVKEDPGEQNNRIGDPECQEIYRQLDGELSSHMLRSINLAHAEKLVNASWEDDDFGAGGWKRTYPQPI
jgi:arylsulfatase A-like enzyme